MAFYSLVYLKVNPFVHGEDTGEANTMVLECVRNYNRYMMKVDLEEAMDRFAELVAEAAEGEEVVITLRDGKSVKIVLVEHGSVRPRFGSARGLVEASEDFDEPLEGFEAYGP